MTRTATGLILTLFLYACIQCGQTRASADSELHMVVDAGSSGTRICIFGVSKSASGCSAIDSDYGCKDIPSENGLADLGPTGAKEVIEKGLSTIDAGTRSRITGAALLGTGGFRRNSYARQQEVLSSVGGVLQKERYPATLKVITGEDEGRLAWKSVAILFNSRKHAIIEIGGATVQFAASENRVISTMDGLTESLKRLGKDSSACENQKSPASADECRKTISQKVFGVSALPAFAVAAQSEKSTLYGLGAPWNAVFKTAGRNTVSQDDLDKLAKSICGKTAADLEKEGMGDKAKRACLLFSFSAELLLQTKYDSIKSGNESWPRGAAASGDYFSDCKFAKPN